MLLIKDDERQKKGNAKISVENMHSNVFHALRLGSISCTEEPGMLQSIGLQKVGYD